MKYQAKKQPTERIEKDLLGELALPFEAPYGIHTARALRNTPIAGRRVHARLIQAFGTVKRSCARCNGKLGYISNEIAGAIDAAAADMERGDLRIPAIDAYQGGAGTSTNLAVSEAIAHRATENLQNRIKIEAIGHVNLHQSTNDTYPTALKIAILGSLESLTENLTSLHATCRKKAADWNHITALGRTEYMDATAMNLGARPAAWAQAFKRDLKRICGAKCHLRIIPLGGTAIGTGIGAPRDYIQKINEELQLITDLDLHRPEDAIDAIQNSDSLAEIHGALAALASSLIKIAGDLRFLASGPQGGIAELRLPPRQAGSSIMPGKINPVIPEAVTQAAIRVLGNQQVVTTAAALGHLELNPFSPLMAETILESIDLLSQASLSLGLDCLADAQANEERCQMAAQCDSAVATSLVEAIGYAGVTAIVTGANAHEKLLKAAALHRTIPAAPQPIPDERTIWTAQEQHSEC